MKNIKLFNQFVAFLKTIKNKPHSTEDVKLINLIIANFDTIAESGTAAGKRGKIINDLIQRHAGNIPGEAIELPEQTTTIISQQLFRLQSLEAECFRGFTENCEFNFDKQFVLVYGPNGSGKSSLCESLEYTLLGYINEAQEKRIALWDYIKNAHAGNAKNPVLKGVDEHGVLVDVSSDPDQYHFCFVEKCRIDAFARLSAHTPTNQKELLSALFGLEEFNAFVNEFTDSIEKYIPVEPIKQKEFDMKQQSVEGHRQTILNAEKKQKNLDQDKIKIRQDSKLEYSFEELDNYIHGKPGQKGRLADLQQQISPTSKSIIFCPAIQIFFEGVDEVLQLVDKFSKSQQNYELMIRDIDFSKLYNAVLRVEEYDDQKCPVCETPVSITSKNPYEQARNRLEYLKNAAQAEEARKSNWTNLAFKKDEIIELTGKILDACQLKNVSIALSIPPELIKKRTFALSEQSNLLPIMENFLSELNIAKVQLVEIEQEIISHNNELQNEKEGKKSVISEFNALNDLSTRMKAVLAQEKTINEMTANAQKVITEFNAQTGGLQTELLKEAEYIATNKKYVEAHKKLKLSLVSFKDNLPIKLVKDLNDLVKEFYNLINKDDQDHELLASIHLPTTAEQLIKVSFRDRPNKLLNALQVLSEGHIKCLGLSILLAKSIHEGVNFIVFDDIVNAIDDDHRGYIRDLFLTNPHFADKQLIITSHSEEFIKDFETRVSKKESIAKIQMISLLKPSGKRIEKLETTSNYVLKAEKCLAENNKRDSLANSRRALENITYALWNKLIGLDGGKYNIKISVQLLGPKHKPELLNLLLSLRKALRGIEYPVASEIGSTIDWLGGLETSQPNIWQFLNKGTHEESERDDFDNGIVKQIVQNIALLDEKVKGKWEKDKQSGNVV